MGLTAAPGTEFFRGEALELESHQRRERLAGGKAREPQEVIAGTRLLEELIDASFVTLEVRKGARCLVTRRNAECFQYMERLGDKRSAQTQEEVGAVAVRVSDTVRHGKEFPVVFSCKPGGDERPGLLARLDHKDSVRHARHDAIA